VRLRQNQAVEVVPRKYILKYSGGEDPKCAVCIGWKAMTENPEPFTFSSQVILPFTNQMS
jgi:hypothetical protein